MSLINILESENEYIGVSELITFKPLCKYTAEFLILTLKKRASDKIVVHVQEARGEGRSEHVAYM